MEKWLNVNKSTSKKDNEVDKEAVSVVSSKPWVEKYRPKTVDDVAHQDEVVAMLKKCLNGSDFPNLLFYGPPGTGKTSTILATAKELYGNKTRDYVLELNASDDRGINIIRERVKGFSRTTIAAEVNSKRLPPFKLVILDEADNLTKPAQAALRRTMEVECRTTRFCLICNYVSRIIDPITSRCVKFRFKPLETDAAISRLSFIVEQEQLSVSDQMLRSLVSLAEGDLRRAITMLQSISLMIMTSVEDTTTGDQFIGEMAGCVPGTDIDGMLVVLRSGSFDRVQAEVKRIVNSGYAGAQIVSQLHDAIMETSDLNETTKASILERLALVDERLTLGGDEFVQLVAASGTIMNIISKA